MNTRKEPAISADPDDPNRTTRGTFGFDAE
jgi:hypothetical protein